MSVYGRGDPWGVPLEIVDRPVPEDQRSRNNSPAAVSPSSSSDATHHSWLLPRHRPMPRKRYVDLGCLIVSRRIFLWSLAALLSSALLISLVILVRKAVPHHHPSLPAPDNYTVALHHALMFFNAQRSGRLPKDNNVTWRGNSGLTDDVVGGFYDDGSAAKNTFHTSFAMTMLSWSAIEYRGKYEAAGELDHVKDIIKWGLDYLLKTFNASSDVFGGVVEHVGSEKDESCWTRPEDIDYPRTSSKCQGSCPDLAAEMVTALASASILFKDDDAYSKVLVHGAQTLWKFTRPNPGENDTVLGEFVWGGAWLYLATGNASYLSELAAMIGNAHDALASPASGVLSLDKKLIGAQINLDVHPFPSLNLVSSTILFFKSHAVLLTRLRLFLSPGYPYEETLEKFHNQTNIIMCSYLPVFKSFKRTKDGMILLNNGKPRPLQYVVNAAFLASLYSDYLETLDIPGWFCGPRFFSIDALRDFARFQINYILGNNYAKISYVVGYGSKYPQHVHHRGASIPASARVGCQGWKWRDSKKSDPNTIVGAMVAGPDKRGEFHDDRINYNYTEPTLAGNAGLVAALVSLSGEQGALDRNTMFSSVQPMFPKTPPSSPPWHP